MVLKKFEGTLANGRLHLSDCKTLLKINHIRLYAVRNVDKKNVSRTHWRSPKFL